MIKLYGRRHWLSMVGGATLLAAGCATTSKTPHAHTVSTHIPDASAQDIRSALITVIRGQQRAVVQATATRIEVSQRVSKVAITDCRSAPEKQVYLIEPSKSGVTLSTEFYACDRRGHGEHPDTGLRLTEKRLSLELDAVKRLWMAKYAPPFQQYIRGASDPPQIDAAVPASTAKEAKKKPRNRSRSKTNSRDH